MAQKMHEHIKDRCELAHTYAIDGAYASAARVLEELTNDVKKHVEKINRFSAPSARGQ